MGPLAPGRIFDNKIADQSEFQFSSHKGGDQWKGNTERYLMSVVPAVHAIFASLPAGKKIWYQSRAPHRRAQGGL